MSAFHCEEGINGKREHIPGEVVGTCDASTSFQDNYIGTERRKGAKTWVTPESLHSQVRRIGFIVFIEWFATDNKKMNTPFLRPSGLDKQRKTDNVKYLP